MNISLHFSVASAWGASCGRGVGGGLVITAWLCYSVEPCRTATLSQNYIWQERGQGREKERWRHEEGKERTNEEEDCGGMQRWSRECSVAWCTVLCAPFPSSRHHSEHEHFFNHSRESRAERSGGCVSHRSVCSHHEPPSSTSPCHTAPCLQLSTYHPLL